MNRVIPFNFENHQVRTVVIDQVPWWVGKDVCDALELSNNRKAITRLEDYEKLTYPLVTSGQTRRMWLVNESGVYSLVLTSSKPEAKRFKRWLTTEALPQIRKTGSYSAAGQTADLTAVNTFIKESVPRVKLLISEKERLYRMNRLHEEVTRLREQLARKNTPLTESEKRQILACAAQWSIAEIARFTNRSETAIRRVIKDKEGRYEA
jgi:prophage antirepressor-like protein